MDSTFTVLLVDIGPVGVSDNDDREMTSQVCSQGVSQGTASVPWVTILAIIFLQT